VTILAESGCHDDGTRQAKPSEEPSTTSKTEQPRGRGREPNPKIQKRNTNIIRAFKRGSSVNQVVSQFGVSAALARQIRCRARKAGKLPPP
jgi:hypothetical protein